MQTAYKQPYLDQRLTPGNGSWHAHTMFMFIIYFHSGLQMLPKGSNKAFHKFLVLVNLLTAPSFPPLVSLQYPLNLLSFIIPHLLSFHKCPTIHLHIYFLQVKSWYSRPAYIFSYVLCVSPHFTRWFPQQSQVFPLIILSGPPVLQLTIFVLPIICSLSPLTHSTTKGLFRIFCLVPGFKLKSLDFAYWPSNDELSHQSSVCLSFITFHILPIAPFSPADSLDIRQTLTSFSGIYKTTSLWNAVRKHVLIPFIRNINSLHQWPKLISYCSYKSNAWHNRKYQFVDL